MAVEIARRFEASVVLLSALADSTATSAGLLESIPDRELRKLAGELHERSYPAGRTIVQEGKGGGVIRPSKDLDTVDPSERHRQLSASRTTSRSSTQKTSVR